MPMFHSTLLRRFWFCLTLLLAVCPIAEAAPLSKNDRILRRAFRLQLSEIQVTFTGEVKVLLSDDLVGDRHQRFIVRLDSGQTLLVVHNIDIAPRINRLKAGSTVKVRGEYIWNSQGGLVHFTHDALYDDHPGGWILFRGKKYH